MHIRVIFIKKKVADVSEIRRVKSLDLIEMVQFMLQLKQNHQIQFVGAPSKTMIELEEQIALYAEKTTEAGGVDYYAPGDELDDLTKALMLALFAARPFMQDSMRIIAGPIRGIREPTMEDMSKTIDPMPKRIKRIHGI